MSNPELPTESTEKNEDVSESPRVCTRKASRNALVVVISDSDSENEKSGEKMKTKSSDKKHENEENIKGTKLIQPETKVDDQPKAETFSEEDDEDVEEDDDDKKDPTYSDSSSKTEKSSTKKVAVSHKTTSFKNKDRTLGVQNFKRKTLLHRRFLKAQTSKNTTSAISGLPSKRKKLNTSYFNRKCKLLKQQSVRRPVGRPRKYFNHASDQTSTELKISSAAPNSVSRKTSVDENGTPDKLNEKCETEKLQNVLEKPSKENTSLNTDTVPLKKRGRPKLIQNLKRKRGRPRLIENRILIQKKPKSQIVNPSTQVVTDQSKNAGENIVVSKRGRPKSIKIEELRGRKKKSVLLKNDKAKPAKHVPLPRTSKAFLQHVNCLNETMKLPKCRECRKAAYNRSTWDMVNSYCRFLEYRKLLYSQNGVILCAGFLQPSDSTEYDRQMWLPNLAHPPIDLTVDTAKELLVKVGDKFCDLVEQEKEALLLHVGTKNMTWKKLVQGIREMCDVCDTTLFNMHWACPKCGFSVCIDCYKVRKQGSIVEHEEIRSKDAFLWLFCHNKVPHEQKELVMAQVVPGNTLWTMNESMHWVRKKYNIEAYCKCMPQDTVSSVKNSVDTGICKQLMCTVSKSFATISVMDKQPFAEDISFLNIDVPDRAAEWMNCGYNENFASINSNDSNTNNSNYSCLEMSSLSEELMKPISNDKVESLSISELLESIVEFKEKQNKTPYKKPFNCFNNRYPQTTGGQNPLRTFTVTESSVPFKDIPHSWLCSGRLLLLHRPDHVGNIRLFQEQWKRGQPIMVMGIDGKLDMSLWHPDGFCKDFGDVKNDLVNCKTGVIIPNLPMKKFWLGFENFNERMKDDYGEYMLLKLKDWPPGEDFSEKLPKRFQDLMRGLPLPEYTHRDGVFNLAGRLPSWFVRPDLGPKMYNAYGSALFPTKGTTNLHLDISDAVNVMVYVGIPHDGKDEEHILEALKAIDEGGCDSLTKERVRSKGVRPGALWHIYDSKSADKIRDLLTKVAVERGERIEAHHDPIHDQSWYLDAELRKRLSVEYGVEGYAIAQCLGDAVFIPAGAPHQVRNLHSCVKVAEDFVSPENIAHCFKLTQEFRNLSDTHTNHEDKLQIKNIIYHVVKDALSHLLDDKEYAKFILKQL